MTYLSIKVIPNASKSEIIGYLNNVLKIKVTAKQDKGKANHAVENLLSKYLCISIQRVKIKSGRQSSRKIIEIEGLSLLEIENLLGVRKCR